MNIITEKQLSTLQDRGCLMIPAFCADKEVKKLQQWSEELARLKSEPGKNLNYYEQVGNEQMISRIENFLPFHPQFDEFINVAGIFKVIEDVLDEPAFLFKEKINFHFPGTGWYPPHQDVHAFDRSPLAFQPYHINAVLFIDNATIENGCLEIAESVGQEILPRDTGGSIEEDTIQQLEWEYLEASAGDLLILDMFLPHRSSENRSSKPRRTLFLTFNGVSKGDLRKEHYEDRLRKLGKTREINPKLFTDITRESAKAE